VNHEKSLGAIPCGFGGEIMKTAAVSELKARLSEYLNRVKAGEEVLVTDRGNPVARLVPISRARTLRDSMANMEKRGLMKLGSGRLPKDFWRMVKAKDPRGSVLQALLEERGKVD
jgi:prevent-host-death family protein